MYIKKVKEGNTLVVNVVGRLDTSTAPQMEEELKDSLEGLDELIIDCKEVEYVSSAGLRVLLSTQKKMKGNMKVRNVNEDVNEIFEVTGFSDILNIEVQ